ncbi:patatin-like phospholipase family protein [Chitinophaga sp. GCM10012297]|uniref:Patatin-like phospholipase family protein n=1 Tax=Chitinophaga chungangae TaxID=2821488 RepID=A0ABS3YAB6_9BACT|nr:patatin-like phospholipase family protein [Chitinophaga chungangae]MBO9151591.1 patatin-like phospholipase family protein [Chitinophaga chungangae]
MWRIILILLFAGLHPYITLAQRPGVGLTLSGGGAKGLAHIGILQAIDSAGLKIDYITGTSMGSIVGGLYAIGYSGDSIEAMARKLNWNELFSNQPVLDDISYEEKAEYNRYMIEIPFEYGKPKLTSGVISGEQLWLELARMCWPVRDVKDFSKFSIPFKCIATDVATGEIVTLDGGELVSCMRASMAIPSVFTAVKIGSRKLVDGGVVRNFPTITARDMGAKIIIGSNVSGGLRPAEELVTPIDILYQLGFYKDAQDFVKARKITDVYIHHELKGYGAASFGSVDSILEEGKRKGRELYPVFKHLADSLNALYPEAPPVADRLPQVPDIEIVDVKVKGLLHSDEKFFRGRLGLQPGGCYSPDKIREAILNVYGTRFYKQITYHMNPLGYGRSELEIDVEETPLTYVKLGLHYNTFTNVSAIVNITQRNFIVPNSRAFVTVAISENPRLRAEYFKYLGRKRNVGFGLGAYYENDPLNYYDNFKKIQEYRSKYANVDVHMQFMLNRVMALGVGTRWEYIRVKPKLSPYVELDGNNKQYQSFFYYGLNTVDRKLYPTRGAQIQLEGGVVYGQNPDIRLREMGEDLPLDSLGYNFNDYQRLTLKMNYYFPLSRKSTLNLNGYAGFNFNYDLELLNDFMIGGVTDFSRNQIPFAGLYDGEINTSSVAAIQLGWQYELLRNVFVIPRANAAVYDLNGKASPKYQYVTGYGITAGFASRLGPMEATIMYSDQARYLKGYVNLGFHF